MKPNEFIGTWHIYEMSEWDKDYFNMEVQAFIKIEKSRIGEFRFGLVKGSMDGRIVAHPDGDKYEFTWEGSDEGDDLSGSGWLKLKDKDTIEGEIKIHLGDTSAFLARRTIERNKKISD